MYTKRTLSYWKTFLIQYPNFVGFGNLHANTLVLSDVFLVDPTSDELEVMFRLEDVGKTWTEKLNVDTWKTKDLNFVPNYANHYLQCLANSHDFPITPPTHFYIPLAGDHLYYESRAVWINKLRIKLYAFQTLIQSFPKVYYQSNFISKQEIEELLQLNLAG